ncbi:efflux RND transporter periplasmic adaptor subunit [Aestuariibacter sp. AA17]|uniref:Efflux RND transporter periplasmic adaptor subunit n=1 Tax=Fluctibacter corallii TaxID=2984329 RepID=A0ABT3AC64_9ALTE|nr:efflux RND transporter periplasmic adaptor subunit [Aestuariibacter sp. AA17]MCV2886205.1 efflux RND transporter periplasmic adaptor subunit [Aestuariibacter sp. AA17]
MKRNWIKILAPVGFLVLGFLGMKVISATAEAPPEKEKVDTRPHVSTVPLTPINYISNLQGYGEVKPLETTRLAAQVSGEVVSWHPQFIPGGLVKRGEKLFSIEKDTYEAALLRAQADLSRAEAQLIEELARADVAKKEAANMGNQSVSDLYLRKPQVLSAQAAVTSAKAALKLAKRDLENCDVLAPFDALITSRDIGIGQFVSQGAVIAHISNIEVAEIVTPIAGFDTPFLPTELIGQTAITKVPGKYGIQREGAIVRDLGVVDETTRMSQLVVRINDPYGLDSGAPALKFGSYVEITFKGKTLNDVYKVRQEYVTNNILWVAEDDTLIAKEVEIIREENQYFLIRGDIIPKDQLVLTLPEYPQSGMAVKVTDKTASPNGAMTSGL